MKRFLRWCLDFLERKFPDKVVVTQVRYETLEKQQVATVDAIEQVNEKIKAIELNLLNLNQAIGFVAPKLGMLER